MISKGIPFSHSHYSLVGSKRRATQKKKKKKIYGMHCIAFMICIWVLGMATSPNHYKKQPPLIIALWHPFPSASSSLLSFF